MVNIKRKKRAGGEFSAGSMADITFLLLLFFLVTTNIDVDTGIGLTLPEYVPPEEQELVPLSKERLFSWHAALFPTGYSGLQKIRVGKFRDDNEKKCRDHDHRTGEFRGATHQKCNINYF